jgi:hypothetical protein
MADEGTALDMDAIDDAMGVWLESVEWVGVEYAEGEMPDVLELDLIEKADRSAAGRKAARARWGNRGPDSDDAKAKRSDAARRAAATRRAKREAGEPKGPETDEQAAARMGKEFEAKRSTGEPIDAIREIGERPDYVQFIRKHADALGLVDREFDGGLDEPAVLMDAISKIRAIEERNDDKWDMATEHVKRRVHENVEEFTSGKIMAAADPVVAATILRGQRCKSQFETQESNGLYDPEIRATWETAMLRVHPGLDAQARPTYGYFAAVDPVSRGPLQYGSVRFELRESVASRTTGTLGDSLGSSAVPVRARESVTRRQAHDSIGHLYVPAESPSAIEKNGYMEAQIMGGWDRSDVVRVYVPSSDKGGLADAAAAAAGIPVEYY